MSWRAIGGWERVTCDHALLPCKKNAWPQVREREERRAWLGSSLRHYFSLFAGFYFWFILHGMLCPKLFDTRCFKMLMTNFLTWLKASKSMVLWVPVCPAEWNCQATALFIVITMLFSRSRLSILISLPILSWKYSCEYSYITACDISVFKAAGWY